MGKKDKKNFEILLHKENGNYNVYLNDISTDETTLICSHKSFPPAFDEADRYQREHDIKYGLRIVLN